MSALRIGSDAEGASIEVWLSPRSSHPGFGSVRNGALELRVSEPPVEGKANRAAQKALAKLLDVPRSGVLLVRGGASRRKVFRIRGLTAGELRRRVAHF